VHSPAGWFAPTESEALLDDVEVDSGTFARGGGLDEGSEASDNSALTADDLADVFLVDFELVDRGVAILDLVDFDRGRFVDERSGDVLDQPLQVGLELFFVFQQVFFVAWGSGGCLGLLLVHGRIRRRPAPRLQVRRARLGLRLQVRLARPGLRL
jgi:hypothetical protein